MKIRAVPCYTNQEKTTHCAECCRNYKQNKQISNQNEASNFWHNFSRATEAKDYSELYYPMPTAWGKTEGSETVFLKDSIGTDSRINTGSFKQAHLTGPFSLPKVEMKKLKISKLKVSPVFIHCYPLLPLLSNSENTSILLGHFKSNSTLYPWGN